MNIITKVVSNNSLFLSSFNKYFVFSDGNARRNHQKS